jgi:hypothetical protein
LIFLLEILLERQFCHSGQGCQMAYFQTKNPSLGKFRRIWQWKMLVYFMAIYAYFTSIWYTLWSLGIFYSYLVYFSPFGMLCQEKSGNPDSDPKKIPFPPSRTK